MIHSGHLVFTCTEGRELGLGSGHMTFNNKSVNCPACMARMAEHTLRHMP